jgi:integrase
MRDIGLPHVHFHTLRHSHISQPIAQGSPMKAISERAGHAGIQITVDRYGHLPPRVEDAMMAQFEAHLRAAAEEEPPENEERQLRR